MQELRSRLQELENILTESLTVFPPDERKKEIRLLEAESVKQNLWDDPFHAQKVMRKLSSLQRDVTRTEELTKRITEALSLVDLAEKEGINEQYKIQRDLEKEVAALSKEVKELRVTYYLSGQYDESDALLSVHAGQGGTEAMDWAEMLLRMYLRYAEKQQFDAQILDSVAGEEAGVKSATIQVSGEYAYGYLKGEAGTHRLVRQSPFNADSLRQTSFALVEVLPVIDETVDISLRPDDIAFEAFRSSGHGGQNVNKVSTAVRIRHIPTGLTVTCQSERSQAQNRENAMKMLYAKLWDIKQKEVEQKKTSLKGEHKIAGWGNQIRSYVLHPYHMVKDLRTAYETGNTQAVLDGEIQEFIEAELQFLTKSQK
ncbi:MAG TPA: peptide chain release factor 2 [Patescibacteria group bacterium]|nr:peptide chain release factor 2 [Patescibacteria group bacterium]